ncbi:MAG: glutamate-1-semialdehyde-2,1-aminomutase [Gammaproteobacteria bacterium]|nr:glutamate-1-semialdehyde-2,1-aminomutase [Gammaproteobacteria bacterium]
MERNTSAALIRRAEGVIPGGVNSPVRAFRGVGGTPVFFESAEGAWLVDVDGNRYIDYVGSWGPMIQGHGFAPVVDGVRAQSVSSLGFGAPTELEIRLAERIVEAVPGIEKVRLVNSGTEATMSAIRLARGHTGRDLLVKFDGCYHGHSDALLVKAGSGVLTLGLPNSPGVPESVARHTVTLPFNDPDAVQAAFERFGSDIACVIVEPVAGNMGCIPPAPGFLEALRALTNASGSVLIFDEVMTGFRVAAGGAQERYGVTPDLTTLGKVIGGGLPVGAFGGRADLMDGIAPVGAVYQAGTLSGNPLATTAGLAMLDSLDAAFYANLAARTEELTDGLAALARRHNVPVRINRVCGMFSIFFTSAPEVRSFDDVARCDTGRYNRFFHALLDAGVYFAPSAFEAAFLSGAHGDDEIRQTLDAADGAFAQVAESARAARVRGSPLA